MEDEKQTLHSKAFSDEPAEKDLLGCQKYFEGLSKFIIECPTPMTIAIQGGWGTGKTSAMQIIKSLLKDQMPDGGQIYTIDFNTWQYAKTANKALFVPLLCALIQKVDETGGEVDGYEKDNPLTILKKFFFESVADVVENKVGIRDISNKTTPYLDSNDTTKEEGKLSDYFESLNKLKEALQKKITSLINPASTAADKTAKHKTSNNTTNITTKTKDRIVIFVDDLDRLSPEVAVELLEDMKNIMSFHGCVFVLALDHEIVKRGLEKKYGDIEDYYAERFFDKIIQIPFSLPVNKYNINNFLQELEASDELLTNTVREKMAEILSACGDTNPRTIKRALNILHLYLNVDEALYRDKIPELFTLLLLQMNHKSIYKDLVDALKTDYPNEDKILLLFEGKGEFVNTGNLFNSIGEKHIIYTKIKEVFSNSDGIDYYKLYRMILETSLTETEENTRALQIREMESLLRTYIEKVLSSETSTEEKYIYKYNDKGNISDAFITISKPGKTPDHVNLNIQTDELTHETEDAKKEYVNKIFESYGYPLDSFAVVTTSPAPPQKDKTKTNIIYNSKSTLLFRNINLEHPEALLFVGKVLRNIKDYGRILPQNEDNQ